MRRWFKKFANSCESFGSKLPYNSVVCWIWSTVSFVLAAICLYAKIKGSNNYFWISFLIPAAVLFPPLRFPWWARFVDSVSSRFNLGS